jgi:glutaminyl-tRNA synthetase
LKYGPVVRLVEIVKNANGEVDHVKVEALPDHKEKLKGYLHWVSKDHSVDAVVNLYSYLFTKEEVTDDDWEKYLNPESLVIKSNAKVWKNIENSQAFDRFQFERLAYFVVDRESRTEKQNGKLVFNRIVELKEAKEKKVNLGK